MRAERYGVISCNEDGVHRYVMRLRTVLEDGGHVIENWRAYDRKAERWLADIDIVKIPVPALRERMLNG